MPISELIRLDGETKAKRGIEHTPREIAQQPNVWGPAAECVLAHARALGGVLDGARQVILTGAGSSYYAGVSAEAALTRALERPVRAIPSTEIVMDPESLLPKEPFALVSLARSGNSPEGNAAFELAEALRGEFVCHVVITCNPDGVLASLANRTLRPSVLCLLPPETNDRGLAMTSSFTSLVVGAQALGFLDRRSDYLRIVEKLSAAARVILDNYADPLLGYTDPLLGYAGPPPGREGGTLRRAVFVGARPFFGAALESHLKVQELTAGAVIGKAEDTLGLRHGPLAAVDRETLVVLFGSENPYRRNYERDLMSEIAQKRLGWKRITVGPRAGREWHGLADLHVEFDPNGELCIPDELASAVLVLPAQIIGLYESLALGLAPDAPSKERVINRVVQGVKIYPWS